MSTVTHPHRPHRHHRNHRAREPTDAVGTIPTGTIGTTAHETTPAPPAPYPLSRRPNTAVHGPISTAGSPSRAQSKEEISNVGYFVMKYMKDIIENPDIHILQKLVEGVVGLVKKTMKTIEDLKIAAYLRGQRGSKKFFGGTYATPRVLLGKKKN
ncbi:hypothetical protein QJS10_CPA16g00449 [Acorus calamus]|uniref:Uncharacterized protein n=1 Tax=Acorus calamus TaxID=4465 RepID=A0AAV9D0H9_ACOCL|nr:hypothetical protein QJS10_CPA16g00449 [Acorus calamus]